MILSWGGMYDESKAALIVALHPTDLLTVTRDHIELDLAQIPEAEKWHGLRIILTGPAGAEALLKAAVESRDSGKDVRYRGRPGLPDE